MLIKRKQVEDNARDGCAFFSLGNSLALSEHGKTGEKTATIKGEGMRRRKRNNNNKKKRIDRTKFDKVTVSQKEDFERKSTKVWP